MQSMLFSDIFHNLLNKFYQKNAVNTFCRSAPLLFTMSWIILISQRFLQICSASFYKILNSFIRKKSVPLLLTISWIYFFLNAVNAFLGSVPLLLTISWIFFSEKTRAKQICSATFYNIMNIFYQKDLINAFSRSVPLFLDLEYYYRSAFFFIKSWIFLSEKVTFFGHFS